MSVGSSWAIWDLHVHTPLSLVQWYGGDTKEVWERYITDLESLPDSFKVLGINDYLFIDGYLKVLEFKKAGRLKKIDRIFPVVEFRLDRFVGNKELNRINYHIIFSDELNPQTIQQYFLDRLSGAYLLSPQVSEYHLLAGKESLTGLGQKVIDTTFDPTLQKTLKDLGPLEVGFNNLSLKLDQIKDLLKQSCFDHKFLTAIGKSEWEDMRWESAAAEKRDIINQVAFIFTASSDCAAYKNALKRLRDQGVRDSLLHCSDAHYLVEKKLSNSIGHCFNWIKAEPTFDGLRQALYEWESRVQVSELKPVQPIYSIDSITIDFPEGCTLQEGSDIGESLNAKPFFLIGKNTIRFSPYFTCLIGGRGSGKSTLLNIIHEKLKPKQNAFFNAENRLKIPNDKSLSDCITISGNAPAESIEIFAQNQIDTFAKSPEKFTEAIISRLDKLDDKNELRDEKYALAYNLVGLKKELDIVLDLYSKKAKLKAKQTEIADKTHLVNSFSDKAYLELSKLLQDSSIQLERINSEAGQIKALKESLAKLIKTLPASDNIATEYGKAIIEAKELIEKALRGLQIPLRFDQVIGQKKTLDAQVLQYTQDIREFLVSRGVPPDSVNDVSAASEAISKLTGEIQTESIAIEQSEELIRTRLDLTSFKEGYAAALTAAIEKVNKQLKDVESNYVKTISLKFRFDEVGAFAQIAGSIAYLLPMSEAGRSARIDSVIDVLHSAPLTTLDKKEVFLTVLKQHRGNAKTLQTMVDYFSADETFETFKYLVKLAYNDLIKHSVIDVSYDGKAMKECSFGQRCTAAVVLLLALGNGPILIDEPEAHLDSSLIANHLVNLVKTRKIHRQILFATHNANFVLNGDAEFINILRDDANSFKLQETTIENMEHRDKLLALEGGADAFQRRERRYQIDKKIAATPPAASPPA